MRLSIVIPSHNRPDLLAACLDSVRRHAPREAEILVVDDDSPGGCVSAVARSAGVGSLQLPQRGGFCVAAEPGRLAGLVRAGVADASSRLVVVRAASRRPARAAIAQRGAGVLAQRPGLADAGGTAAASGGGVRQDAAAAARGAAVAVPA